jgi:DNA processing protein
MQDEASLAVPAARVLSGAELPQRLSDLASDAPERLYLHGELPRGPAVAVVGTRYPSPEAVLFTRRLAEELARAGVAVLSGGAKGIDTAAHEGALRGGGVTVVVTPAGFAHPYPKQNAALYRDVVARGGAYLSTYPDDVKAERPQFFERNSVMCALAHAVVVTQLGHVSGASNAAKWARKLGRPVFVVLHSPWVKEGAGALKLLHYGARPLDRAKDVLDHLRDASLHPIPLHSLPAAAQGELFAASVTAPRPVAPAGPLDPVLAAIHKGAGHADEIADRTGLPVGEVHQRLLTLTLSGVLVPGPLGSLKLVTD